MNTEFDWNNANEEERAARLATARAVVEKAGYKPRRATREVDPWLSYRRNTWWSSPSGGHGKVAVNIATLTLFEPGGFQFTAGANNSSQTRGEGCGVGECFVFEFDD